MQSPFFITHSFIPHYKQAISLPLAFLFLLLYYAELDEKLKKITLLFKTLFILTNDGVKTAGI